MALVNLNHLSCVSLYPQIEGDIRVIIGDVVWWWDWFPLNTLPGFEPGQHLKLCILEVRRRSRSLVLGLLALPLWLS